MGVGSLLPFPREFADVEEFYWLWILATTAYGVGDTLTTLTLHRYAPAVVEGNPIVAAVLARFGFAGLAAWKIAVICLCLAVSVRAARQWEDRFSYYFPPVVLTLVGSFFTVYNLRLLLG
ncbi:hypothetical protein J2752_000075 [Halarchaeum rubridurum]|uniref:DUF5658 domain-containing protein n=1 Tax=Halarchaeum rubridurum TaxID=489911 RepID=A0A830FVR8_9EURY|nr:hypothetical protein [Halarchaeum rubridurum]MBP1953194.1 hypothetical protein [Halarchaeum rubridurum]GGM67120.1 hypothetical protein GCM10009017_16610 [Halarchaeum rubridurum]